MKVDTKLRPINCQPVKGIPVAFRAESLASDDQASNGPTPSPFLSSSNVPSPRHLTTHRRVRLPILLFILTCVSTFIAGTTKWTPMVLIGESLSEGNLMPVRRALLTNWSEGITFMACLLAILLTHEMGHFLTTVRYKIPASLPFFLPLPISPIGTLGAVIGMDGRQANRKETFDIGIAGPIAGLLVAIPITWVGVAKLNLETPQHGLLEVNLPLALQAAVLIQHSNAGELSESISQGQLNPYLMAGWVGLLITGLNMLPISQLDGGHVIYTLFGKHSHWFARGVLALAVAFVVVNFQDAWGWMIMISLILLIGPDHPPTRDDLVPLGWFRVILGIASLFIPIACFPPIPFQIP